LTLDVEVHRVRKVVARSVPDAEQTGVDEHHDPGRNCDGPEKCAVRVQRGTKPRAEVSCEHSPRKQSRLGRETVLNILISDRL
jgi:hypothetical protein